MNSLSSFLTGTGAGLLLMSLVTGGLLLSGGVAILPGRTAATASHLAMAHPLTMLLVVGAEELFFRALLVGQAARLTGVGAALLLSAIAFVLLHLPNGLHHGLGMVNAGLFSLLAGLAYLKGGFALAWGLHYGWNLMQWPVLGYPMYGRTVGYWFHVLQTGPFWLTGYPDGPESSPVTTAVMLAGALWLWRVGH